jgi:hypothetical protein
MGRVGFEPTTPAMSRLVGEGAVDESVGARESESSSSLGGARWFNSDPAHHHDDDESVTDWRWQQFHNFLLQQMTVKTAEDRLRYARKFQQTLYTGDATALLQLSPNKRIHVMKALSALARFTGRSDVWQSIYQKYQLSWSTGTEKLDVFQRFFDDSKTLDRMIQWAKEAISVLPPDIAAAIKFNCLTGLRSSEVVECVRLLNVPSNSGEYNYYYNPERQCLEHFRYPEIFLRRTKAAYISLVNDEILAIAKSIKKIPTINALKMQCKHRCLSMQLKYCRKIYASWLRQQGGLESEIVDLLQGRVPKTVFSRHYLIPADTLKDRVLEAVIKLKSKLEQP